MSGKRIQHGDLWVEVVEATAQQGIQRSWLSAKAGSASTGGDAGEMKPVFDIFRYLVYPALIAAVSEHGFDHWPLSPDEVLALPDRFVSDWSACVFELNPHWMPGFEGEAEKKRKRQMRSTSASRG